MIYKIDGDRCGCGKRGCLETLCSIGIIERKARVQKALKFSDIAQGYAAGENNFSEIIDDCAQWLGVAVANQINFLIPDVVVLTGEIFQLGSRFYTEVVKTIQNYVFPVFMKEVNIRMSQSWEDNAVLGAASILTRKVFENLEYIR